MLLSALRDGSVRRLASNSNSPGPTRRDGAAHYTGHNCRRDAPSSQALCSEAETTAIPLSLNFEPQLQTALDHGCWLKQRTRHTSSRIGHNGWVAQALAGRVSS